MVAGATVAMSVKTFPYPGVALVEVTTVAVAAFETEISSPLEVEPAKSVLPE